MFQDTADMPGTGNGLERSKKKLDEQKVSIRNYKQSYQQYDGTQYFTVLY